MSMITSMNDWNRSLLSVPFVGGSAVIMAAWSSGMILPSGGRGPRFDSGISPVLYGQLKSTSINLNVLVPT